MQIKSLTLKHFRCHTDFSFIIKNPILIIIGKNTSGKTNILEALDILTHAKSKKCENETDLIQKGIDNASIEVQVEDREKFSLQVIYYLNPQTARLQKKYLRNNLPVSQLDFAGNFLSVSFFPEDLKIVTDSPGTRRNFLNQCLTQTDAKYKKSLQTYERTVRSRNAILEKIRNGLGQRQELEYWNEIAIANGQYLTKKRNEFIYFLNHPPIDNVFQNLEAIYDKSEISEERLAKYAAAEIAATSTLVGPHRDDLTFVEKSGQAERNLKSFGSRGEQRLLVLFLKLKELEYIERETHEKPVLLLDDIFSELDTKNRGRVIDLINGRQTIITTADEKELESLKLENCQKIYLK